MKVHKLIFSFLALILFIAAKAPEKGEAIEVQWLSFEEAVELNNTEPRKILIDLYTDWCGWCKKMDKDTYARAEIIDYLNDKFYAVKFNAEQKEDVFFNDHTFKFVPSGRRGYHELAAALTQNQLSYPTTVFMDEQLQIIQPIPGYLDARTFDTISKYIGEEKYKDTPWAEFQKNYQSKL
jgi:thioredoxin-related protein